jgi:hypothetical protein
MAAGLSRWAWMTSINASPTGVRRSFGALAPHTDESTTVGEADVADDGAQ